MKESNVHSKFQIKMKGNAFKPTDNEINTVQAMLNRKYS